MDLSNDKIIHQKKGNVEYLQFRKLLSYPELVHCYTLSVNDLDFGSNDTFKGKEKQIRQNYTKLAYSLGISEKNMIRPGQNHTNIVKCVTQKKKQEIEFFPEEFTNVDGLLTNQKDIVFSLTYADCTPLYLWDPIRKIVGNIHSGWKGTLNKIGEVAVIKMIEQYGANPKDIICCIGPCIKQCHFEVAEDVASLFYEKFQDLEEIENIITYDHTEAGVKKYHIDTTKINHDVLKNMGLLEENIIDSGLCTVCHKDQMHSYRANGKDAGRNTAIIGKR